MNLALLSTGPGLIGMVIAMVLLSFSLLRVRLRRLEILLGEEMGQFLAHLAAILLVWAVMGLLGIIPVLGPYVGWDWISGFLGRMTPTDPLATFGGMLFCFFLIPGVTISVYQQIYARVLLPHVRLDFPFTPAGRWTAALACFYLGIIALDLIRACFSIDPSARITAGSGLTLLSYCLVIGGAPVLDARLRRFAVGPLRGFTILRLVAVGVLSSLVGSLLLSGSVHLGPLAYAAFFRELIGSAPAMVTLAAGVMLFVFIWRPGSIRRLVPSQSRAAAPARGDAPTRAVPPPDRKPKPAGRPVPEPGGWRRYDRATRTRVGWP